MKRVLIITYYWPPSGGAGVQRWLKFVKYLPDEGWTPVVVTPENPEMPYIDESLLKDIPAGTEIMRLPIAEPYTLYNKLTGKKKGTKFQHGFLKEKDQSPSWAEKVAIWIRGNVFIPDARVLWVRPTVRFLTEYLRKNPVDLIVTTGPPHSIHLIGKQLKKKCRIPWIADFRDPWTGIYYFDKLMLSAPAKKYHQMLEKSSFNQADHLITVGSTMQRDFRKLTPTPVSVITNGYDHSDYESVTPLQPHKFTLLYTGMFLPDQNPKELWQVLKELSNENADFESSLDLQFIGKTDAGIIDDIHQHGLSRFLKLSAYVPHEELPARQQHAALLLLSINRIQNAPYILTGKVFEYLASGKPILAICPAESDVAKIIRETSTGWIVPFNCEKLLKQALLEAFADFTNKSSRFTPHHREKYSRKSLTKELTEIMNAVVAQKCI